jgi:hypothetical protein
VQTGATGQRGSGRLRATRRRSKEIDVLQFATRSSRRELACRSNNGIDVRLLWSPDDDALAVTVDDASAESFELVVEPAEALDVFEHPYAHAAFRGVFAHAGLAA